MMMMMTMVMMVGARNSRSVLNDSVGRKHPQPTVQSTEQPERLQNENKQYKSQYFPERLQITNLFQDNLVLDFVLMFGSRGEVDPKINICFEATANMARAAM